MVKTSSKTDDLTCYPIFELFKLFYLYVRLKSGRGEPNDPLHDEGRKRVGIRDLQSAYCYTQL